MQKESHTPQTGGRAWRALVAFTSNGAAAHLTIVAVVIAAVVALGHELEGHITGLETWLANQGSWGLAAFLLLFVVGTTFLLPDSLFCIVSGALFGIGWGTGLVATGALLGNILQYTLAKRIFRGRIQRILAGKPGLAAIQRAVLRDELRLQVLLRLTPINPAVVSYLLGAAGVRFRGFLLASMALHPTLFVEVYFGHAGKHMVRMVGGNTTTAVEEDVAIVGGLVVCAVVLYLVSRMARKALREAVDLNPESPSGSARREQA